MKTREQIEERIAQIEKSLWYINMADRLDFWEEQRMWDLERELRELKETLKSFE